MLVSDALKKSFWEYTVSVSLHAVSVLPEGWERSVLAYSLQSAFNEKVQAPALTKSPPLYLNNKNLQVV